MDLVAQKGHVGAWELEDDPHLRSRLQFGNTLDGAACAATHSSPLIAGTWPHFDRATATCTIEIRWSRRTSPGERSNVARLAVAALRTWLGPAAHKWTFRAKNAPKPRPALPTLPLPPEDEQPNW